jgi:hypothetical protein
MDPGDGATQAGIALLLHFVVACADVAVDGLVDGGVGAGRAGQWSRSEAGRSSPGWQWVALAVGPVWWRVLVTCNQRGSHLRCGPSLARGRLLSMVGKFFTLE